jgi:hypothetical protein
MTETLEHIKASSSPRPPGRVADFDRETGGATDWGSNAVDHGVQLMAWDFSTDPQFQKKLDWVEEFCREEIEPLEYVFRTPSARATRRSGPWSRVSGPGQGAGPVGHLPRRGTRRPRLRAAEARVVERDPGAVSVGAADVRGRRPDTGNMEMLAAYGTEQQKSAGSSPC